MRLYKVSSSYKELSNAPKGAEIVLFFKRHVFASPINFVRTNNAWHIKRKDGTVVEGDYRTELILNMSRLIYRKDQWIEI